MIHSIITALAELGKAAHPNKIRLSQPLRSLSVFISTENNNILITYAGSDITYAGSDLHLIQSSISHDLEKLSKWLVSNKLTLNATKTEFMLIGSRQRLSTLSDTLELSIDNVPIEKVSSVKSLGIYVDENLTWYLHVDKLCKKIASAIGAIKRVKPFVPQSTLLSIYNSLVNQSINNLYLYTINI